MQEDFSPTPLNTDVSGLSALQSTVTWISAVGITVLDWMNGRLNSQLDRELRSSWLLCSE
jgi:hypothetical protein